MMGRARRGVTRLWRIFAGTKTRARVSMALLAGGSTVCSFYSLKWQMQRSVPSDSSLIDYKESESHIYPVDPDDSASFLKRHFTRWWPVSLFATPIALQLFEEISDHINTINEDSLKSFAKLSSLLESECNQISMCMDLKTAIALARCGADPRLFMAPKIIIKDNKDYYGNKFRTLFSNLENNNLHGTLDTLISTALKMYHPTEKEQEDRSLDYYSGFESDFHLSQNPVKAMGEREFLTICLSGVVSHSRITASIPELLSHDILDLLVVISRDYRDSVDIMSLVLKVLANISCDTSSAQLIKDTGCLKILAEYARSSNIKLSLPAKRALHNLDRRETNQAPILPPGVYQLHPEFGCDDCSHEYDVVFIHGLLGGVFRTWRRHDVNPADLSQRTKSEQETRISIWKARLLELRNKAPVQHTDNSLDEKIHYPTRKSSEDGEYLVEYKLLPLELEDVPTTPTQCWPRDWLPTDCPKSRIIGVDFESFVSRWMTICPIETSQRRLKDRSAEILNKLQEIGIGQRPVLWITHSLGGLLLKSIMCQAEESDDINRRNICSNTKGVVFCSVPHLGTDMAVLNTARRWLLLPTEEIEELSDEDKQLTKLNECFIGLYNKYKFKILSFGEVLETRTGLGMKFKLVPFYSSDIGVGEFFPLHLDHLGTCKPWSRGSFIYKKTVQLIKEVCPTPTPTTESPSNTSLAPPFDSETQHVPDDEMNFTYLQYISNYIFWFKDMIFNFNKPDPEDNDKSEPEQSFNSPTPTNASDSPSQTSGTSGVKPPPKQK